VIVWFFFSSRRRHTIFSRDWSSDVCSSDLRGHAAGQSLPVGREVGEVRLDLDALVLLLEQLDGLLVEVGAVLVAPPFEADGDRVVGGARGAVVAARGRRAERRGARGAGQQRPA